MVQSPEPSSLKRRELLGVAGTAGLAATSGCMRRLRSITGWQSRSQVSMGIRAVPADADPYAFRIARSLAEWFQAAGIDASVEPLSEEQLLRSVLLDHDFEVFVGQLSPGVQDPDGLYQLLHSRYVDEAGWQNPFGYANLSVDEDLEAQRTEKDDARREVASSLQETLARTQPFSTVAFPEDARAARRTRFANWSAGALDSSFGYLQLERATDGEEDAAAESTLRGIVTDTRVTENLNPLSVEFRRSGVMMDFLYDALGYVTEDGNVEPWLADAWTFSVTEANPTATVSLRDGLTWHDGEALTARDVAFTFSLLDDTNGSAGENPQSAEPEPDRVPAPRFRGLSSLVDRVYAKDPETVVFEFVESAPNVAASALTAPVLPEHVWAERRTEASVSGVEFGPATEAIVTDNVPPIGSGPLQFVRNNPGETLVLERFEDHFLTREDATDAQTPVQGGPAFDRLEVRVVASNATATQFVVDDEADVTMTSVGAKNVPQIGRADDAELLVSRSNIPYVVGYNVRRPPLSNSRFRNTLVHLIDKAAIVDQVFDGYADPAASALAGTEWLPDSLEWNGENPVTPFLGADGEVNVERARAAFRDAGFMYEDGELLRND